VIERYELTDLIKWIRCFRNRRNREARSTRHVCGLGAGSGFLARLTTSARVVVISQADPIDPYLAYVDNICVQSLDADSGRTVVI
jgi:hypothetical protein